MTQILSNFRIQYALFEMLPITTVKFFFFNSGSLSEMIFLESLLTNFEANVTLRQRGRAAGAEVDIDCRQS